jgi:lipopolysaccharide/colanic/teichoic acid biosynthesis glycosyltransferase
LIKRLFDIIFSFLGLLLLLPLILLISIIISIETKGGIFFRQIRVGLNNQDFYLLKFRTMYTGSDKKGLLTVGNNDVRITLAGSILRKYKIDELPQLINVLKGDMSFVGPRPEVRRYVELYNEEQKKVLCVKPGITDYASIKYRNENELLKTSLNPEKLYLDKIMPQKLSLNLEYINNNSILSDLKIIVKTIYIIIKG